MRFLVCCFTFLTTLQLAAIPQELPKAEAPSLVDPKEVINLQLSSLDHLIAMSRQSLEAMEKLRTEIKTYQTIQLKFLQQPEDKELLFRMSKLASQLQHQIQSNHFTHVFNAEFIKELNMLTKIYKKNQLPRH